MLQPPLQPWRPTLTACARIGYVDKEAQYTAPVAQAVHLLAGMFEILTTLKDTVSKNIKALSSRCPAPPAVPVSVFSAVNAGKPTLSWHKSCFSRFLAKAIRPGKQECYLSTDSI